MGRKKIVNLVTLNKRLLDFQAHKPKLEKTRAELYDCCYQFMARFLYRLRKYPLDNEDMIIFFAEELYLLVMEKSHITSYLSYLDVAIPGFWESWTKFDCKEPVKNKDNLAKFYNPLAAIRYTNFDVESITDKVNSVEVLRNLVVELNKFVKHNKRFTNNVTRLNAHTSIALSIKYGEFINFRLHGKDEELCRFLYNKFRLSFVKIINDTHKSVISDEKYLSFIACEVMGVFDDEDE